VVVLARRIPKLATCCLTGGLLLACASGPVQGFVFGLATDLVLKWRLEGGKWAVSSISEKELGSGLGSTIGAVFGAVLAVTVTGVSRNRSRPSCSAQPASALPDQTGPNVV
jgi:hypothetical protein